MTLRLEVTTLTRVDIVKKLYEQHAYLANEYGVTKIGAFGS